EARGAQGEVAHTDAVAAEGDGDRADHRGPVRGSDGDLVAAVVVYRRDPGDAGEGGHGGADVAVNPGHDHVVADRALQVGGGALGHDATIRDDPHPIGQLVGLLQVLGGEEDRH